MGKKPLNENQVKSLRKLVSGKPLHELLLNLSVDLMLRGSDLMNLKVSDMISENGKVKTEVMVKQKKTKNIDAVRRLLGHSSVTATSNYIGVTDNSALDLARTYSF